MTESTPEQAAEGAREMARIAFGGTSDVIADCGPDLPLEFGTRIRNLRFVGLVSFPGGWSLHLGMMGNGNVTTLARGNLIRLNLSRSTR